MLFQQGCFARVGKATEADPSRAKDRGKVIKQNRRKVVVPKRRDIQDFFLGEGYA